MFEKEQFIADCRAALDGGHTTRNMRDVVARAVADPAAILAACGEPNPKGIDIIHRADDLTIINVFWAPKMVIMPHNHEMWAVIGVYSGCEDNILWRRLPNETNRVEAAGAKSLRTGDTLAMGADIIHSVINPIPRITSAIHVYGGDFFATPRSEWDPESLTEKPYDMEKVMAMFAKQ